jgi:outer membrane protein assembly factor BamE
MQKTIQTQLILICTCLFLTACSGFQFPGVYKIDIPQGNIIDKKDLAQVELGMTQEQIKYLLGTPLITDTFHPERWDYAYSYRIGATGKRTEKHLTLTFNDQQRLASMQGSALDTLNSTSTEETETEEKIRHSDIKIPDQDPKKQPEL